MSVSVIVSAVWVVAATAVAMLPMRRQFAPGLALLVAAPALIVWLGLDHGWGWSIAALLAFLSMFRHPLRYLWRRVRHRNGGTGDTGVI